MAKFLVHCIGPLGSWKYVQDGPDIETARKTAKSTGAKVSHIEPMPGDHSSLPAVQQSDSPSPF